MSGWIVIDRGAQLTIARPCLVPRDVEGWRQNRMAPGGSTRQGRRGWLELGTRVANAVDSTQTHGPTAGEGGLWAPIGAVESHSWEMVATRQIEISAMLAVVSRTWVMCIRAQKAC